MARDAGSRIGGITDSVGHTVLCASSLDILTVCRTKYLCDCSEIGLPSTRKAEKLQLQYVR